MDFRLVGQFSADLFKPDCKCRRDFWSRRTPFRVFLKGYLGLSALNSGNLKDEDFPPGTTPYSSTNSDQHGGQLKYGTVDFGWDMRSENYRLGFFAGYFFLSEQLNAYGCTQTASNPGICVPTIPNSVLGITDDATWNAVRLGGFVQWTFGYGFSLTTEVAWLPVGFLAASDFHWLRPDLIKPIPENGAAFDQVQLEALLNYHITPSFSVGVGGRYWNIGTTAAQADFLGGSVGTNAITFRTETWGAFVQASYKFGEIRQNSHPCSRPSSPACSARLVPAPNSDRPAFALIREWLQEATRDEVLIF